MILETRITKENDEVLFEGNASFEVISTIPTHGLFISFDTNAMSGEHFRVEAIYDLKLNFGSIPEINLKHHFTDIILQK